MKTINNILLSAVVGATLLQPAELMAVTEATSQISSVMVYPEGAMVSRKVSVRLKNGLNEIKVPLLTPQLDQKSVQVGVKSGNATLVGVKYDVEVPNRKAIGSEIRKLSDRNMLLRDSIDIYQYKHDVLDKERNLLLKSDNIGGNQGFTASTLQGVTSYVRADLTNIVTLQYGYRKQIDRLQEELNIGEQQMNLQTEKQIEPKSCLLVSLEAASAGNCELEIQYFVEEASWMPFYEARILQKNNSLHLVKKAYVSQGSKEGWKDVDLLLSQNNPTISNKKPELLRYELPYNRLKPNVQEKQKTFVKVLGVVRDDKAPLKGALVTSGDYKTETDENGFYELLVPSGSNVDYSYKNTRSVSNRVMGKNVKICNVELSSRKSQVAEKSVGLGYSNYISQNRLAVNNVWTDELFSSSGNNNVPQMLYRNVVSPVPGKNSVPDDGADHEMLVEDININAEYTYHAVPKLSKDVYLVASIPNWKDLDLQDGAVKLFLNNMFMGESFINARQTEDTLLLSVGVDKELAVERKDMRTYSSKNLLKTSNKEERDWQITIKNNKQTAVRISVEDQYPVSTNSDVKVELVNNGGAKVNAEEGKLTWVLNLKPGEKKELRFSYTVKSKDKLYNVE
ncbi:MAG: mucoidy inhibitor MuiA family protein [Paludibacteraceae bacterium]|nr:mucoidy inhibitor MuiA family protein [Paludibacteraceae bacterium]